MILTGILGTSSFNTLIVNSCYQLKIVLKCNVKPKYRQWQTNCWNISPQIPRYCLTCIGLFILNVRQICYLNPNYLGLILHLWLTGLCIRYVLHFCWISGTDVRHIQDMLGRKSSKKKEIYTHLSTNEVLI